MTASATRLAAPESYTPKHLAEKILTSKSAMEGERKLVTVMFSDVSGFTAMSEKLDPEDVHGIMERVFEVIISAVHRYEGNINQFLGDGVMALFGAPIAHEDHPHRALSAALAIQQELQPVAADVRRLHGVEFRMRMGINTGLVWVGAIGKDLRMDYTAVGDTTNLAARFLGLAKPGQIVVSQRTQRLLKGFFVFEDLGEFQVKGKSEPVRAYAVVSEIHGRTSLEVSRGARADAADRPRSRAACAGRYPPPGGRRAGRHRADRRRTGGRQVAPALRIPAAPRGGRRPPDRDLQRVVRPLHGLPPDHRFAAALPPAHRRCASAPSSEAGWPSSSSSSA